MASITSAQSGLSTATSTWVGGVVPVAGDKVTIAHPGTNTPAVGNRYVTSAPLVSGAVNIPVISGSGTIVAGESIQLEIPVGTDHHGLPILHSAYYKVVTGIAGAGTIVIEAPGLLIAAPAAGVRVVNRGHVVTLAGTHVWGDDTSNANTVNLNAIAVNGTLSASRTVSSKLTCRGSLVTGDGGTVDLGYPTDSPIPAGVTCEVVPNATAGSAAQGKHVISTVNRTAPTFTAAGKRRTRIAALVAPVAAGANVISVDDSTGWEIGDRLALAALPGANAAAGLQVLGISGGSHPNWTLSAPIVTARPVGTKVGNLSSNVVFSSADPLYPGAIAYFVASSSVGQIGRCRIRDVRFQDIGSAVGWNGLANQPHYQGSIGLAPGGCAEPVWVDDCASEGANLNSGGMATFYLGSANPSFAARWATVATASANGTYFGDGANARLQDNVIFRASVVINAGYGAGAGSVAVDNMVGWAAGRGFSVLSSDGLVVTGGQINCSSALALLMGGRAVFRGTAFNAPAQTFAVSGNGVGAWGSVTLENPVLSSPDLFDNPSTVGLTTSQSCSVQMSSINGNSEDSRNYNFFRSVRTDVSTKRRSTYSVRIRPHQVNNPVVYTFSIPTVAGVSQKIIGSLMFDAAYGTATPPKIEVSGSGVAASFIAPGVADTWHTFTFDFVPTATGEATVTVTCQTASASAYAWLDGVWHYPMIQSVRHHGFQWLPQTAQLPDTRITLTEAAALALPVSVDHTAQTITVSGAVTARQVFEACMADLVQTANQTRAVHITSATGDSFETSYTVVTSGAGVIAGAYEDATGRHVTISAPALIAGSRVQVYDLTTATELYNAVLATTGLILPVTWTADHTIRLRAEHADKLALQTLGVLGSAGLSFLDVQADDDVYLTNGIDGSTCTEFAADGPNVEVDISDPDGVTSVQRLYAWAQWYQTTATGIASDFFGAIEAVDAATYLIDQSKADITLDNVGTLPVRVVGGYLARRDGHTVIASTSGSIQMDPGKAYLAGADGLARESTVQTVLALSLG